MDQLEEVFSVDEDVPRALSPEQEKQLWRKVDLRLMPILSFMYLLAFMDRGNIGTFSRNLTCLLHRRWTHINEGNAKLDGLMTQLHLNGDKYNIALTMFFISYCTFECPSNLVLKLLRPSRYLPAIMVLWGIVMTCMAFVKTYPQLVAVRFCLGFAEAGLFPGVVYYLTLWYPRHMLQYRVGLFFGAATLAGAFSGLLAFGLGYMGGIDHLEGWSWIFIIEGLITIVGGCFAFFVIVDFPSDATFLTDAEGAYLIWRKKYDSSTVGEEERFALRHIVAALTDWQLYLHILVYMSIVGPLYGITFFLPTIIKNFGYSTATSQLLTVPPYVVSSIVLVIVAHYSDKLKNRSILSSVPTFFCSSATLSIYRTPQMVSFPGVVAWLGNNLAGQYKRAVGLSMQIGIGNFSGAIAANIYLSRDSPRYILGHGLEIMFVGIGIITLPILVFLYKRINDQRDEDLRQRVERGEKLGLTVRELRDLGDRAPDFRYTL
ncbi:MFS general substrate transporter [Chiua virens]|nr:MFS general substrate transporter [Chiua virens]